MTELTDLEICNKIAIIEGYKPLVSDHKKWHLSSDKPYIRKEHHGKDGCFSVHYEDYDPLSTVSRVMMWGLMVKYEVFIDYHVSEVIIVDYESQVSFEVDFYCADGIPRAILECIIMSRQ